MGVSQYIYRVTKSLEQKYLLSFLAFKASGEILYSFHIVNLEQLLSLAREPQLLSTEHTSTYNAVDKVCIGSDAQNNVLTVVNRGPVRPHQVYKRYVALFRRRLK